MIRDLDDTLKALLKDFAPAGSQLANAEISFELPDAAWRKGLLQLTVNCYLYDIQQNLELRTEEPKLVRSADGLRAKRMAPPVRLDCAYCITAWSPAANESVLEEHQLLSQLLLVLLRHATIPPAALRGSLITQQPPYPTVIASREGVKNQPEFWAALDQKLKPSLNYVVTLAMQLEDTPAEADMTPVATQITVDPKSKELQG